VKGMWWYPYCEVVDDCLGKALTVQLDGQNVAFGGKAYTAAALKPTPTQIKSHPASSESPELASKLQQRCLRTEGGPNLADPRPPPPTPADAHSPPAPGQASSQWQPSSRAPLHAREGQAQRSEPPAALQLPSDIPPPPGRPPPTGISPRASRPTAGDELVPICETALPACSQIVLTEAVRVVDQAEVAPPASSQNVTADAETAPPEPAALVSKQVPEAEAAPPQPEVPDAIDTTVAAYKATYMLSGQLKNALTWGSFFYVLIDFRRFVIDLSLRTHQLQSCPQTLKIKLSPVF